MRTQTTRTAFVAGAAAVVVYFIWFAGASVRAGFSHDDLMNMHGAFVERTFWRHIGRSFVFFLPATRPLGAALYRLVYHAAGLNPLLLHATCFALALLNLCLLFFVTAKISGSREIGLLAASIGAFHDNFLPLYYNSGLCYDLLSFVFFYLAFWRYVSVRERRRTPGLLENAVILACFTLALGAKEIALSFPLVLIAYELIWDPPRTLKSTWPWLFSQGRTALLGAAVGMVFVAVRVYGAHGLAQIDAYKPAYSLAAYLRELAVLMNDLVYRGDAFTPAGAASFWGLLIAIAALVRSRFLVFCIALALIGILPIAFISSRGLASAYVPWVGFWAYAAALLVYLRRFVAARLGNGSAAVLITQTVLFCAVLIVLTRVTAENFDKKWVTDQEDEIGHVIQELGDLHLQLPKGAHVLMVKDPLAYRMPFSSFFILRLFYHDPRLELEQCAEARPEPQNGYDAVVTYQDGRFSRVSGCAGRSCCH